MKQKGEYNCFNKIYYLNCMYMLPCAVAIYILFCHLIHITLACTEMLE